MYIKKSLIDGGTEKALKTYLHESCHHETGCDDLDRDFVDHLCKLLTNLLLKYSRQVGIDSELIIVNNTLILPKNISISVNALIVKITAVSNELTIKLACNTIHAFLQIELDKPYALEKKISLKHGGFCFSLPEPLKMLNHGRIHCKVI